MSKDRTRTFRFDVVAQGDTGTWLTNFDTREDAERWVAERKAEGIWRNAFSVKVTD